MTTSADRVRAVLADIAAQHPAPPTPEHPRFQVAAVRTHCVTRVEQECEVTVEVRPVEHQDRMFLYVVAGGVTGYESADWQQMQDDSTVEGWPGWAACAGTPGRWDRLVLDPESLRTAMALWRSGGGA